MQAARDKDGKILAEGDKIKDFRGEEWEFVKTGTRRVVVKRDGNVREFFPHVFNLELIDR